MFKAGDRVVYPHHGAAIVEEKKVKTIFGSRKEYLILRMVMDDMTVSVPVEKVEEVLSGLNGSVERAAVLTPKLPAVCER